MTLETASQWATIIALIIAAIGLFWGVPKLARKIRSQRQQQNVGDGGIGVQSGQDSKVEINGQTRPRGRK